VKKYNDNTKGDRVEYMKIPGLDKLRMFILASTIICVTCVGSMAVIDSTVDKTTIQAVDNTVPIFKEIKNWDSVQGLTAIAILSILYSGFLSWQGLKKIGDLEKANREMIIRLGNRKCLLEERDYINAVGDFKKMIQKD
jgi:hypothetical protein